MVSGSVSVQYTVTPTPVTIGSNFAVPDGQTFSFLVGQQADFYVSAGGYQLDQYQWGAGGNCLAEVRLGAQVSNPQPQDSNASFYDARETIRDEGQFIQAHPSWYYDGGEYNGNVQCSVRISDGAQVVGTVTVLHQLHVYRPTVNIVSSTTGPSRISDPSLGMRGDSEWSYAGSPASGIRGMVHLAQVKLPGLFIQAQGLGQWSYVQKCSDTIYYGVHGGNSHTDQQPTGLDTTCPYGGIDRDTSTFAEWWDTTYTYTVRFEDSPKAPIGNCDATSRNFAATTFMALRPPVYQGQHYVDMPVEQASWTYSMSSSRDAGTLLWFDPSAYTQIGSSWETTPSGQGVTLTSSMQPDLNCGDMDWHYVVL